MDWRRTGVLALSCAALIPSAAEAQVVGTFRWQTEPYCNVLTLRVTQSGAAYTLDGFDEQCGGNPRLPVHGIAVVQANGSVSIGLSVVPSPGDPGPVNVLAAVNLSNFSGTWRDSAGNSGAFLFNPGSTSGGPRPGPPPPPAQVPAAITLLEDGGFAARGTQGTGSIPAIGAGTRMMWHPAKGAFRAGQVSGGEWNDANVGAHSAAFGVNTMAVGSSSFAFGSNSGAMGTTSVAGGNQAFAHTTFAVALGDRPQAGGVGSVALGTNAITQAAAFGSFVYGDRSGPNAVVSQAPNQFIVRAAGGVSFFSNAGATAGVALVSGGSSWLALSDVNMKENFRDLAGEDVLEKIARMPIREWNYKTQDAEIRHVGPTAQDFHAAFGLGEDPLRINTIDADGVALRAIQALEQRDRAASEAQTAIDHAQTSGIAALRARVADLERRLTEALTTLARMNEVPR